MIRAKSKKPRDIQTSMLSKLPEKDRAYLKRSACFAAAIFILMAVMAASLLWLAQKPITLDSLGGSVNRFDSEIYLSIASHGYPQTGPDARNIVFFPFFPILLWLGNLLVSNMLATGILISIASSVVAGYFLQKIAKNEGLEKQSLTVLAFFFLFPSAYFLFLPYTEALFCALTFSAFYFARKSEWKRAGILGMLACATKAAGIMLLPALIVEAYLQRRQHGLGKARWLALIPIGLLAYFALNYGAFGNPLTFVHFQNEQWSHYPVAPWDSVLNAIHAVLGPNLIMQREAVVELAFAGLTALLLASGAANKMRLSYQVYGWSCLLLFLSVTWEISFARYMLVIFPSALSFGMVSAKSPRIRYMFLGVSAIFFAFMFSVFAQGGWAY